MDAPPWGGGGGWLSCGVWHWDSCSGLVGSFEDVGWCVRGWRLLGFVHLTAGMCQSHTHINARTQTIFPSYFSGSVVVADHCSLQLFVTISGTPSASVNLPPLFCETCLFILCAFTVVDIVTSQHDPLHQRNREMSEGHHNIRF